MYRKLPKFKQYSEIYAHLTRMQDTGRIGGFLEWDEFLGILSSHLESKNEVLARNQRKVQKFRKRCNRLERVLLLKESKIEVLEQELKMQKAKYKEIKGG